MLLQTVFFSSPGIGRGGVFSLLSGTVPPVGRAAQSAPPRVFHRQQPGVVAARPRPARVPSSSNSSSDSGISSKSGSSSYLFRIFLSTQTILLTTAGCCKDASQTNSIRKERDTFLKKSKRSHWGVCTPTSSFCRRDLLARPGPARAFKWLGVPRGLPSIRRDWQPLLGIPGLRCPHADSQGEGPVSKG